jgi:hypothetical protein
MTLKAKNEEFRRRLLKGGGKVLSEETPGPSPPLKDTPKSSKVRMFHSHGWVLGNLIFP